MASSDQAQKPVKPTERRGAETPGKTEAEAKGSWAATAEEGVVPAELGGSDAPSELLPDDPELPSSVLGTTTGSDEPATADGIDLNAGDNADATSDGGPKRPADAEPDLRDAAAGARQVDVESTR